MSVEIYVRNRNDYAVRKQIDGWAIFFFGGVAFLIL